MGITNALKNDPMNNIVTSVVDSGLRIILLDSDPDQGPKNVHGSWSDLFSRILNRTMSSGWTLKIKLAEPACRNFKI